VGDFNSFRLTACTAVSGEHAFANELAHEAQYRRSAISRPISEIREDKVGPRYPEEPYPDYPQGRRRLVRKCATHAS